MNKSAASAASPDYVKFQAVIKSAATPSWIKRLNFQGPSFWECLDDSKSLALQVSEAPEENPHGLFCGGLEVTSQGTLGQEAENQSGRRGDTGGDSSREVMI